MTLQDVEALLIQKIAERNNAAEGNKPSPQQRYETSEHPRLPAPSFDRLAHLVHQIEEKQPQVTNDGLFINGTHYKPRMQNADDVNRYASAVDDKTKAVVRILQLSRRTIYIASIDGHPFEEIFRVDEEPPSEQRREEWARTTINRSKRIGQEFIELAEQQLMMQYQGIPLEDPVTKLPIEPQQLPASAKDLSRTTGQSHDRDSQRAANVKPPVSSSRTKTVLQKSPTSRKAASSQPPALEQDESAATVLDPVNSPSHPQDAPMSDPAMDAAAEAALEEYQRLRAARRQRQEQ